MLTNFSIYLAGEVLGYHIYHELQTTRAHLDNAPGIHMLGPEIPESNGLG